jgi:hypothetical protein
VDNLPVAHIPTAQQIFAMTKEEKEKTRAQQEVSVGMSGRPVPQ